MTTPQSLPLGVNLPPGMTASSLMLHLLQPLPDTFPRAFGDLSLPSSAPALKRDYPSLLMDIEQRRCAAPERLEIARALLQRVSEDCFIRTDAGKEQALSELSAACAPLEMDRGTTAAASGWTPAFHYRGREWRGHAIADAVDDLEERRGVNRTTADVLRRALSRLDQDGALRIPGERFAMLGAGAELAPTRALLEAGATVLWADIAAPPTELQEIGGELVVLRG
ncbi:MAG: hypothetical protein AAGA56_19335, partial [Myxococcota bacterium]